MEHAAGRKDGFGRPRRLMLALDAVLAVAAAGAVAALVLEYGFRRPPVPPRVLHAVEGAIVGAFVLDRLVRLAAARRRRAYLRDSWIDFALMLAAAAAAALAYRYHSEILGAGALYVLITQAYLLVSLILRAVGLNLVMAGSGIHPTWLLLGSFAFLCLGGSGLLMLPAASAADAPEMHYPDALFTATSATCVTGLITKRTGTDFSLFGQAVILALIQLGGLGIMLFGTVLAVLMGKGLSVRGTAAMGHMLGTRRVGQIRLTVLFVVLVTLSLEAVGAALLYPMFSGTPGPDGQPMGPGRAVWCSVFHGISCFCNAGFSLYDENMMAGVSGGWAAPLRDRWQIMGVMAPLIVLGGLGFPVLQDVARYVRGVAARAAHRPAEPDASPREADGPPRAPRLSLHAKIVLAASAALILLGAIGLLAVEPPGGPAPLTVRPHEPFEGGRPPEPTDWGRLSGTRRAREAVFLSISARTAGFNTLRPGELSNAGKLWVCLLMLVGGSPAGTAGGMKTVTVVLLGLMTWRVLRRRSEVEVFRRSIAAAVLRRATAIAVLYLALVVATALLLSITLRGYNFLDVLFESCSACGTVGLSTGVTAATAGMASPAPRYIMVAAMFLGRLGPLTLLLALTSGLRRAAYAYPREEVLIG
jgi:trk system potassium uptake protein TrkH